MHEDHHFNVAGTILQVRNDKEMASEPMLGQTSPVRVSQNSSGYEKRDANTEGLCRCRQTQRHAHDVCR